MIFLSNKNLSDLLDETIGTCYAMQRLVGNILLQVKYAN